MPSWQEKVPFGGGRVRASVGFRRFRPVLRKSFAWVGGGRSPPPTHAKQFSPKGEQPSGRTAVRLYSL